MADINGLMNEIEDAVKYSLSGRVINPDDIIDKVRALVAPVFDRQEQLISKRYEQVLRLEKIIVEQKQIISKKDSHIGDCEERIEEMAEEIDRYEGEQIERQEEDEREEVVRLFNYCAGGKVVYL